MQINKSFSRLGIQGKKEIIASASKYIKNKKKKKNHPSSKGVETHELSNLGDDQSL